MKQPNHKHDPNLSQWFSPDIVQSTVSDHVETLSPTSNAIILDPAAGDGSLLTPFLDHYEFLAIEIDPRFAIDDSDAWHVGNALAIDADPYWGLADIVIMNPPFERQQDRDFVRYALAKTPDHAAIVCVLSTRAIANKWFRKLTNPASKRHHPVAIVSHLTIMGRVRFDGPQDISPRSDFCVVTLLKPGHPLVREPKQIDFHPA